MARDVLDGTAVSTVITVSPQDDQVRNDERLLAGPAPDRPTDTIDLAGAIAAIGDARPPCCSPDPMTSTS